jgi:DNA-directed RNA polymerase subunit RPC12/RpoP
MEFVNEISCKKCGKKYPIEEMQLDKYAEKMICSACAGKAKPKTRVLKDGTTVKAEKGSLSYSKMHTREDRYRIKDEIEEMTAYKCTSCNYEFKRRKAFPFNGRCPYCNKDSVVKDPIKSGKWVENLF